MNVEGITDKSLQIGWDLQKRINVLDSYLSATVVYPNFFKDPKEAAAWFEEEIMQLECEQLAMIEAENEKSRRSGQLSVTRIENLFTASIPSWEANRKEGII